MPRQNLNLATLPGVVVAGTELLGRNIALARKRRRLRLVDLAAKTGLAVGTLRRVEEGHPSTALSAYFVALWALGLEREFANLASPDRDEEGKTLERARMPARVDVPRELDDDF